MSRRKLLRVADKVIGGENGHHRIITRALSNDAGSQRQAGCRVALGWFGNNILGWQRRRGIDDRLLQNLARDDEDILDRHDRCDAIDRILQHRAVGMQQWEQLLWFGPA